MVCICDKVVALTAKLFSKVSLSYNTVNVITDIISDDIKALILQASIQECLEMWRDLDTKACKGLDWRTKLIY